MAKVVTRAGPSLIRVISEKFKEDREVPPLTPQSWLRVSALSSLCAREEVLASLLRVNRHDIIGTDLLLTFNHGHGLHWALQNRVLAGLGVLYGRWRCTICGARCGGRDTDEGNVLRPSKCGSNICRGRKEPRDPETNDFEYEEQYFTNKELRIGGHNDGFLRLPGVEGEGVLEGKSISDRRARDIKDVPDFGHVVQLQSYMWLTDCQWGVIVYWNKGTFRAPLVEHFVERDDETIEKIKAMIRSIWAGMKGGALPERLCRSSGCERAEACSMAGPCFERDTPGQDYVE